MIIPETPDKLHKLKKAVENSSQGFKKNYENFTKSQKFVFVTSMDENSESVNEELNRPSLEFNVIEAVISRFCGEFAKNEPGIMISASDDFQSHNPQQAGQEEIDLGSLIKVLEGNLRHIRHESNKMGTDYHTYRDQLSGGFSGLKIHTEYESNRSRNQVLKLSRVFDPILVGYDPLAMRPDKSDGEYCFEIFPMRKSDFERQFPDIDIKTVRYVKSLGSFQWSYMIGQEEVILVADFYEKHKKKTKLYELADGQLMFKSEYKEFLKDWEARGEIELPPIVVFERDTEEVTIIRYQIIENAIISEEETDYTDLPLKFVDGNSVLRKDDLGGNTYQFTRPFLYQAMGAQMLLNFAGQCLAHELQDMRPAQLIAALEAIPEKYIDGYRDPKALGTIIYNHFYKGDKQAPLPAPQHAPRPPIPAEIMNTFMNMPVVIKNILGMTEDVMSKDRSRDLSGKAMDTGLEMSNSVVVPYLYNHDLAFESAAQMLVDMMPLYYNTPRTLPIITEDGKRGAVMVNQPGGVQLKYKPGDFKVKIETTVNFSQQQRQAMQQITSLMQVPMVGQFVSETSIDLLFDNIDCRDSETWRGRAEIWMQEQQKAKQAAMQQAAQQPKIEQQAVQIAAQQAQAEAQIGMAKIEQQAMSDKAKTAIEVAKLELEREKLRVELARLTADMHVEEQKLGIDQQRADDERVERIIDNTIKQSEHTHNITGQQFERSLRSMESDRNHEMDKASRETEKLEKQTKEISE